MLGLVLQGFSCQKTPFMVKEGVFHIISNRFLSLRVG
jgi:hypothetical protein